MLRPLKLALAFDFLFSLCLKCGAFTSKYRICSRHNFLEPSRTVKSGLRTNEDGDGPVATVEGIQFQLHSSISDIPSEKWDICLSGDESASPFMQHSWLRCLEQSKCVSRDTGWMPQHISIIVDGEPWCGFIPLYIKSHSMGEFIFDSGWADAAIANGIDYYPNLLVAVPFTPATGRRILLHPKLRERFSAKKRSVLRKNAATFLKQVARNNKLSSVHINFLTDEEAGDIAGSLQMPTASKPKEDSIQDTLKSLLSRFKQSDLNLGYLRRTSLQYHWSNANSMNKGKPYESFDEYLSCFKSKRRTAVRRERAKVIEDEGIQIEAVVGKDILKYEGLVERMYHIYLSTVTKMFWGRQYLSLEFFQLLAKSDFLDNLCFMCARRKSSGKTLKAADVIAGTFNVVKSGVFYGRYWGCMEEVKNLHFETCYWAPIEYCINNGLKRMEPGAGGGEYKYARGFDPTIIYSAHYICHPGLRQAVSRFIEYETESNLGLTEALLQKSVVGNGSINVSN